MIDDFKPAQPSGKSPQTNRDMSGLITANQADPETTIITPTDFADALSPKSNTSSNAEPETGSSSPIYQQSPNHSKFSFLQDPSTRRWLIIGVILLVVIGGSVTWLNQKSPPKPKPIAAKIVVTPTKTTPVTPTTVASNLSGLQVNPVDNNNPVTGVMVENSTFARPQAGLSQASVVFEAIAEGGITRFLALFQDTAPDNVGPIRSVRPYFEQWALGFDAGLAHVGGSPEALADIKTWNVRDLDQFYNGSYYHRITTRQAPHNVYTSISLLTQLEVSKGYTSSTFTSFPRKPDAPSKQPTATIIDLTMSSSDYNVHYEYNPATNSYYRSEGGAPQFDSNSNLQLSPKVVIAMVMPYSLEADGYHSDYGTIGTGPVYIFQDGTVTTGQWSKSSNTTQFSFTSSNGSPIKLNAGQTWLTAVAATSDVSYTL